MKTKNVEVRVGHWNTYEDENKKEVRIFNETKRVVVEEQHLATLFRRDYYICSQPVVFLRNTNERVTYII